MYCQFPLYDFNTQNAIALYKAVRRCEASASELFDGWNQLPYNCGGKAADGPTASRPLQGGYAIQPGTSENPGLRADAIRPYG